MRRRQSDVVPLKVKDVQVRYVMQRRCKGSGSGGTNVAVRKVQVLQVRHVLQRRCNSSGSSATDVVASKVQALQVWDLLVGRVVVKDFFDSFFLLVSKRKCGNRFS